MCLLYNDDHLHFSLTSTSKKHRECQTVPGEIVLVEQKKKTKTMTNFKYIIDVKFKLSNTGYYTQDVIMEFNDDIAIKKIISVEISDGPVSNVQDIQAIKPFVALARDELTQQILDEYPQPTKKHYLKAKYNRSFPLNCHNYKSKMHKLIQSEEYIRQLIISRYVYLLLFFF